MSRPGPVRARVFRVSSGSGSVGCSMVCPFQPIFPLSPTGWLTLVCYIACAAAVPAQAQESLNDAARGAIPAGDSRVAVAVMGPARSDTAWINADASYSAASLMKLAVIVAVARRVDRSTEGTGSGWDRTLRVHNRFVSSRGNRHYRLTRAYDPDRELYDSVGSRMTVRSLAFRMIAHSSNLATNILMDYVGLDSVSAVPASLRAPGVVVRSALGDPDAVRNGERNLVTARSVATLLDEIRNGRAASPAQTRFILAALGAQVFNDGIPAGVPAGAIVAHKTGQTASVDHDAAIVTCPDHRQLIVVVLTRDMPHDQASHVQADVARAVTRALMQPSTHVGTQTNTHAGARARTRVVTQ